MLALGGNLPIFMASSHLFVYVPATSFSQNALSPPDDPHFSPILVVSGSSTFLSHRFAMLTRPASVTQTVSHATITDHLHTSYPLN